MSRRPLEYLEALVRDLGSAFDKDDDIAVLVAIAPKLVEVVRCAKSVLCEIEHAPGTELESRLLQAVETLDAAVIKNFTD